MNRGNPTLKRNSFQLACNQENIFDGKIQKKGKTFPNVKYSYCVSCHISHRTNVMNKITEKKTKEKGKTGPSGYNKSRLQSLFIIHNISTTYFILYDIIRYYMLYLYHVLGSII